MRDQLVKEVTCYTTTNARDKRACLRNDSNPEFQQSGGCRQTPETACLTGSVRNLVVIYAQNTKQKLLFRFSSVKNECGSTESQTHS